MARKHGATRWQIYDGRRRFRQRGELPSCEASQPPFAPLVAEGPLEECHMERPVHLCRLVAVKMAHERWRLSESHDEMATVMIGAEP